MTELNVVTKPKKKSVKQIVSLQTSLKTNTTDIQKCVYAGYETVLDLYGLSITKGTPLNLEKLCKDRQVSIKKLKEYYFEKTGKRLQLIKYNENSKIGLSKHYEKIKKARNDLLNGKATLEQRELIENENKRIESMRKTKEMNRKKKMLKNTDKKQKRSKTKGGGNNNFTDEYIDNNEEDIYKGGQNINKNSILDKIDLSKLKISEDKNITSIDELKQHLPDEFYTQIINHLNIKSKKDKKPLSSKSLPSSSSEEDE